LKGEGHSLRLTCTGGDGAPNIKVRHGSLKNLGAPNFLYAYG